MPVTTFTEFDSKLEAKANTPALGLLPSTLEGCVVRIADTIAYIGRDIEDAITLGLIEREELPEQCKNTLGVTNGTIVYNLVTDLILNSRAKEVEDSVISFSEEFSSSLKKLKTFNYERIYLAPETRKQSPAIRECYQRLFAYYLHCLNNSPNSLPDDADLMTDINPLYLEQYRPEEKVRDFIAGMTDDFFIKQAGSIGCPIPAKK
jgi:dGTPase